MKVKSALLGLAAASGGLLSANVATADGYSAPARYVPAPTWTGCYLGIQGGWEWGHSKAKRQDATLNTQTTGNTTTTTGGTTISFTAPGQPTITTTAPTDVTTTTIASYDLDGGLIGGTVGCNLQSSGGIVLGVESDASWSGKEGSGRTFVQNGFNPGTNTTREDWLTTTRLRLGWAAGNFLVYATGGAAFANVEYKIHGDNGLAFSQEKWRIGLAYGGGLEWKFDRNWSAKVEYLHINFENQQYLTPAPNADFANRAGGVTIVDDIVRVGINYKFDRREVAPLK